MTNDQNHYVDAFPNVFGKHIQ